MKASHLLIPAPSAMNTLELKHSQPVLLQVISITSTILLILSVLLSLSLFLVSWIQSRHKGTIKLTATEEKEASTRGNIFRALLLSHIDSDLGEDGIPVGIEQFWRKASRSCYSKKIPDIADMVDQQVLLPKSILLLLTSGHLALQIYCAFGFHMEGQDKWTTFCLICEILICVYVLIMAVCNCLTSQLKLHKRLTYHLCVLLSTLSVYWYLATLGQFLALQFAAHPHWTEYCALGLSVLQTVISGTIPLSPHLWVDRSRLYSKALTATLNKADIKSEPNVDQIVSTSIIGNLCYTFAFTTISRASAMDQIDMQDLPAGPATFRIQHNLHCAIKPDVSGSPPTRLGPTMNLLWTVWSPLWRPVLKCEYPFLKPF